MEGDLVKSLQPTRSNLIPRRDDVLKRLAVGCASVAVVAVLAFGLLILVERRCGKLAERNDGAIKIGMTVSEAEAILGPSEERSREYVPIERWQNGTIVRVVSGDRFFNWEDKATARSIWVGVRNGKVCDTWYWEPGS